MDQFHRDVVGNLIAGIGAKGDKLVRYLDAIIPKQAFEHFDGVGGADDRSIGKQGRGKWDCPNMI